ncbi:MAG: hypothetical protein H6811_01540 [Phycisphaeraceae bacterium]|nr:hypothetical protein [Phycisphaeraceae bacterium]
MTRSCSQSRAGVALLIVLATIAAVTASVSSLVQCRRLAATGAVLREWHAQTLDLLRASEAPILDWLDREARVLVLPADSRWPCALVLDDAWSIESTAWRVRIEAWDQCGLPSLAAMRERTELRALLPRDEAVVLVSWPGAMVSSLDELEPLASALDRALFPSMRRAAPELGSILSAGPNRGSASAPINVNTAPAALLEAVSYASPDVRIQEILDARARGERTATAGGRAGAGSTLICDSNVWSFRVEVTIGTVSRAWWCTYAFSGSRWELRQRCGIHG